VISTKTKLHDSDSDGSAAGRPVQPHAEHVALASLADAKVIEDLYLRGGGGKFIEARNVSLRDLTRLREAGLIETQEGLRLGAAPMAQLTARGLQALVTAHQMIDAAGKAAR
jgi:hypothetical protein